MNQRIALNNAVFASLLAKFDAACNDYNRRTGKEPTHIILDADFYRILRGAAELPVAGDAEPSRLLGMEILIDDTAPTKNVFSLARKP